MAFARQSWYVQFVLPIFLESASNILKSRNFCNNYLLVNFQSKFVKSWGLRIIIFPLSACLYWEFEIKSSKCISDRILSLFPFSTSRARLAGLLRLPSRAAVWKLIRRLTVLFFSILFRHGSCMSGAERLKLGDSTRSRKAGLGKWIRGQNCLD